MRRLAALATMSLLLLAGCSSGKSLGSGSTSSTTLPSELAKWLDSLTPPLRTFAEAQTQFVDAQRVGDLKIIKLTAQKVGEAATTLSAAMKQSPTVPQDSTADVQNVETLLASLAPLALQVSSCADAAACAAPLTQFTTAFTDASTAANGLAVKARPPSTTPTTRKTPSVTAGGSTSTTSGFDLVTSTTAPGQTTVPKSPAFATWVNTYGRDLVETAKALGTLGASLQSADPDVPESACAAFISRVNATDRNPVAPNSAASNALSAAMLHTRSSYAICLDDPSIRSTEAEETIRQDFYAMGQAMPAYLNAIA